MDDRAVSVTLNYVLSLTIAALLVTGLLITGSSFVTDSREDVIENELAVIGEQVAADLERVDRLVVAGEVGSIEASVTQQFPTTVTGSSYDLILDPSANPHLVARSTDPEVTVEVTVVNETSLGASHADGGVVRVWYDGTNLVIDDV